MKAHSPQTKHNAEGYGLNREEANERRGAGWWVSLRRRGHKVVRLFKDSIYGSDEATYSAARAYRDAIIEAIPPATNHEQAVLLRKTNKSGISGVRQLETREGDVWQATLTTNDGSKRENFSVPKFGEAKAKSMAIEQRRKWLCALPVTHLAYAQHAADVAHEHFADDLIPVSDVMPETHLTDDEIEARIQSINDEFDRMRQKRLRIRVKYYHGSRLSVFISDAGKPAKRKLVQINTRKLDKAEMQAAARSKVEATIIEFYDADVARWFMGTHGDNLLTDKNFNVGEGFNVLVFLQTELARHCPSSFGAGAKSDSFTLPAFAVTLHVSEVCVRMSAAGGFIPRS